MRDALLFAAGILTGGAAAFLLARAGGAARDRRLVDTLRKSKRALADAVAAESPSPPRRMDDQMDNPAIGDLTTEVSETVGVMQSAAVLIRGFGSRLAAGIEAARAGDFAALDQLRAGLDTAGTDLAAAVAENTPPPAAGEAAHGTKKK